MENTHSDPQEQKYLESLNEKEYSAYLIAKEHLGSSFCIEKSNGFLKWKKTNSDVQNK